MSVMVNQEVVWETHDNFQKQTYRNRCYICTDQGKHMLNIPIQHVGDEQGRQLYKDVLIDYSCDWQKLHWRTLQTAYRTSPFFEFYEDELAPLFQKPFRHLMELNFATLEFLCDCLDIVVPGNHTSSYEKQPQAYIDGRALANAKQESKFVQEPYIQVFGDRHGFVPNASCLDLLFNLGPQSLDYLKKLSFSLPHA